MSRIAFIENREKTEFWGPIAAELEKRGHAIAWLVQNPVFNDDLPGDVRIISFPTASDLWADPAYQARWPSLTTDRGRQFFDSGSDHYHHYAHHIGAFLDGFLPELIVGEATLFHELLCYDLANERGVPFIHPAGERYPQNRCVLFEGVSQSAYVSSEDVCGSAFAHDYATRVANGTETLSYMPADNLYDRLLKTGKWVISRSKVLLGRIKGERYNTPSLPGKWKLTKKTNLYCRDWDDLAAPILEHERAILHPLQMQPEANIDVWGRPFSDQLETIKQLLSVLPLDMVLAVKANPKPKYEMSSELIEFAKSEPRIRLLPRAMPMAEAMKQTLGAVTICGTVGFEAIFGKGRCISICHPIITEHFPKFSASTPEKAVEMLLRDPKAGVGSVDQGAKLVEIIIARSFAGVVGDPFHNPDCIAPDNIQALANAVEAAVEKAMADKALSAERI